MICEELSQFKMNYLFFIKIKCSESRTYTFTGHCNGGYKLIAAFDNDTKLDLYH